jgi:MYXO-CTERM domain-containing protein
MRLSVSLLSLVAIGTLTGQAAAVMPTTPEAGPAAGVLEVKTGDPVRALVVGTGIAPAARATAWAKFQQLAAGTWTGLWDEVTGVPMAVHGSGIPAPGTVNDDAAAERFTRNFLAQHMAMLAPGSSLNDMYLVANITDGEMRTVAFGQSHKGIKVLGADLIFEFKNDRLFVFGSTAFPNVSVPASVVDAPVASLKSSATSWMSDLGRTLVAEKTEETLILPLVRESGVIEYHRVTPVVVTEPNAMGSWTVYVDTATGAQIARKDNLVYADGTLKYKIPERSPGLMTRMDQPAALANVSVGGMTGKSDNYGKVTWTAAGDGMVTANCVGTLVAVNNNTASGTKVTGSVTVPAGGVGVWDRSSVPTEDSQLTCFAGLNLVKEHVARFMPRGQIAWVNNSLTCNVNQPNTCNANWNGTSVQFFVAGVSGANNCENTGRLTDVVYHEFGHGWHRNIVISGTGSVNGGMGEGVGDTLSASITQDFRMAPGFFVDRPTVGIRDLDTTDMTWPSPTTAVHTVGVIYGGWMYDLRKNFKAMYGDKEGNWQCDRLFYESVRRATSIPTSVTQVLAADDDDGNTANGTQNTCAIYEAAKRHTLFASGSGTPPEPPAASLIPGVAPPTIVGNKVTLKLLGNNFCPTPVDLQSAVAAYQVRGSTSPTNVNLTKDPTGAYVGDLPSPGDAVGQYKVTATFANGKVYTFPQNAADPMYEFTTAPVQNLYCTDFEGMTAPADWTHTGTPTAADEWEWGTPGEIALTNDPRVAASGTKIFGMDIGKWTTDGLYPASGTSSLQSPVVNTAGHGSVHLQYRRQLNVETGANDQANIYANGTKVWNNATTGNHVDKEWRFHDVDLSAQAASGTVQVKFELVANGTTHFGGWNIDDFCIVAMQGDGGTTPPPDAGDGGVPDASVDVSVDAGDGGGMGGAAGAAGMGGAAGTAGAAGKAGAAGTAGMGGAAGKGGAAGTAGAAGAAGASGSSGAAGAGGAAGTGGSAGDAGAGGKGGTGGSTGGSSSGTGGSGGTDDDGCSCRIGAPSPTSNSVAWLAALPLVGLALRRRRR